MQLAGAKRFRKILEEVQLAGAKRFRKILEEVQLAGAKRFRKISSNENNKRRNLSKGENCALLNCYTASSGNPLPTFRDNLLVSSSSMKKSSSLKVRQIAYPETSVRNYLYYFHYKPEERSSHLLRFGSLKLHFSKSVTPLK